MLGSAPMMRVCLIKIHRNASYGFDVNQAGEQACSHLGSYPTGPSGVVVGSLQQEKAKSDCLEAQEAVTSNRLG